MSDPMDHLDEGTIHAWLDGSLPPDEGTRIERHLAWCASCSDAVAEARGLIAASSRILSALDAVPGGVIPGAASGTDQLAAIRRRHQPARRRPWWRQQSFMAAASLVLMAGTATAAWRLWDRGGASPFNALPTSRDAALERIEAGVAPADAPGSEARPVEMRAQPAPDANHPSRRDEPAAGVPPAAAPEAAVGTGKMEADRVAPTLSAPAARPAAPPAATAAVGGAISAVVPRPTPLAGQQQQAGAPTQLGLDQQSRSASQRQRAESRALTDVAASVRGRTDSSPRATPLPTALSRITGESAPGRVSLSGCWELRGPAPVGGRVLGVPGMVRLSDDVVPQGADSTWKRASEVEPSTVLTSLIWRQVDSTAVEMRVRRPLDSTVVRFRVLMTVTSLASERLPRGIQIAEATRVVCR